MTQGLKPCNHCNWRTPEFSKRTQLKIIKLNESQSLCTYYYFFYTLLSYEIPPHLASLCNWMSGRLRARCTNCGSSVVGQCGGQTRVSQLSLSTTAPVVFLRSQTMTCVGNPPADNVQETTHRYYIIARRQSPILSTLLLSVYVSLSIWHRS